jgi:WXXGXW repeat (2 copies)
MKSIGVIVVVMLAMVGCASNPIASTQTPTPSTTDDPAAANLASTTDTSAPPLAAQQPVEQVSYPAPVYSDPYDSEAPVEATDPPPLLPEYTQPECPGENYIWTPGTWSYQSTGYYWVPGVWVSAPFVGALWTPPYWGYEGSRYRWHRGFWGRHIGFYGGINYGFGYVGRGYEGGYWNRDVFSYNRAVNNVNVNVIHNVYNHTVVNNTMNRISYNGGRGGINARPVAAEIVAVHDRPVAPAPIQREHFQQAAANREQFASVNHGRPAVAAVATPLAAPRREEARPVQQAQRPMEPARAPERAPVQARQEPRNEMRPVAPAQAHHAEPPRAEPQRQEARPTAVVRQEAHEQPRPAPQAQRQQPQQAHEARSAPEQHAAQPQHAAPAAHPKQEAHPAPPQHNEKPPEKKPEEKKGEKK